MPQYEQLTRKSSNQNVLMIVTTSARDQQSEKENDL